MKVAVSSWSFFTKPKWFADDLASMEVKVNDALVLSLRDSITGIVDIPKFEVNTMLEFSTVNIDFLRGRINKVTHSKNGVTVSCRDGVYSGAYKFLQKRELVFGKVRILIKSVAPVAATGFNGTFAEYEKMRETEKHPDVRYLLNKYSLLDLFMMADKGVNFKKVFSGYKPFELACMLTIQANFEGDYILTWQKEKIRELTEKVKSGKRVVKNMYLPDTISRRLICKEDKCFFACVVTDNYEIYWVKCRDLK